MTKFYCDLCGKEMKGRLLSKRGMNRIKRRKGRVEVEVLVAVDRVWNGGSVCIPCVLDVVATGKDAE